MSDNKKIRVGSRKSELALIQTRHVISLLSKLQPGNDFEIVTMSTLGDKVLDIPLPKIGEKSLFTKELETALATGCVDFVVHSLKDLPTTLPEGMAIGAVLEREDPRDALVVKKDCSEKTLADFKDGSIIGTSSLRRTAQLARFHPKLNVESIRGNLNTRIRKLDELDNFSAIILAQAGLCRMGWQNRITKILNCNEMLYAVGQGALAVECRENNFDIINLLSPLHCPETLLRILAERSFLKTLGGGCSAPVAVSTKLTPLEDKFSLQLTGSVWSLDGKIELKDSEKCTVEIKPNNESNETNVCSFGYSKQCENYPQKIKVTCPYEASPCKKLKTESEVSSSSQNVLSLDDPHKNCPISIPVGMDFMGKCPYFDSQQPGKCPVNAEIQNMSGDKEKLTECPFFKDGKLKVTLDEGVQGNNDTEDKNSTAAVCPYREPKLYVGLIPSKRTPLWALEQAEHLGINLAEKLLKIGALDVMKAAQAEIRGTGN